MSNRSLFCSRKTSLRVNPLTPILLVASFLGHSSLSVGQSAEPNPFLTALNELVDFASVTAQHVSDYAEIILETTDARAAEIGSRSNPAFDNVVRAFDALAEDLDKTSSSAFILFWVSPDSAIRAAGGVVLLKQPNLSVAA